MLIIIILSQAPLRAIKSEALKTMDGKKILFVVAISAVVTVVVIYGLMQSASARSTLGLPAKTA